MDALEIRPAEITEGKSFDAQMFDDFVRFIDRGERTTQTYITNLRQFAAWLRFEQIENPVREDILKYRDFLRISRYAIELDPKTEAGWKYRKDSKGNRIRVECKPNTIAQYLRSVSQFFRWTAAAGLYPNIADNIHSPKLRHDVHRKEALQAEDVLRIEKSITKLATERIEAESLQKKDRAGRVERATEQGKRLYAIYLLAVNAGLRTVEIQRAKVRDLQIRGGNACLYVWGKGHTEADARKPIAPEVYEAVRDYLDSRQDRITPASPLFVATGNRSGGKPLAARTISRMIKDAFRAAGYDSEKITAHSLRHTAGTSVQEITGNLYLTQQYMRHANPATTEIYLHNETERQEAEIARQLYGFYHGNSTTDARDRLSRLLNGLSPEQITKLEGIAEAMLTQP